MSASPIPTFPIAPARDITPGPDALDAYLVIGGFPVLALEWGRGRKLASYVRDALTDPTSFLVVSAERALGAEFPTEVQARTVLGALGEGARAHSRILGRTNLSTTTVNESLHLLARKRVVRRLTPYSARAATGTGRARSRSTWWAAMPGRWRSESPSSALSSGGRATLRPRGRDGAGGEPRAGAGREREDAAPRRQLARLRGERPARHTAIAAGPDRSLARLKAVVRFDSIEALVDVCGEVGLKAPQEACHVILAV